jgi:hypothetical protein
MSFSSMRRPVMCVAGWLQFGNAISPLNWMGIATASLGTLLYSSVADAESKRLKALAAKESKDGGGAANV